MRLKWKLGIGFSAVIVVAMIINVVVVSSIFLPEFQRLDERTSRQNGARAFEFLQAEIESLKSATRDWAQWDDTYEFASDLNEEYREKNLKPEDLETLGVDSYVLTDDDGIVRFQDSANENVAALFKIGQRMPSGMFAPVPLQDHEATSANGIVSTPLGPMLVSIGPVTTSNYEGPPHGYLIFSRLLAPRLESRVRDKAHLDFSLTPVVPAASSNSASANNADEGLVGSKDSLTATYTLRDLTGQPSYIYSVSTPREFATIGQIAIGGAIIRFLGFGLVFWAIVTWVTGRVIVRPMNEIVQKMSDIASTGNLDKPLDIKRSDEIGWVADVFNKMIRELKTARSRQMEQSYVVGMADLSAGVLNNIRSALKPVIEANQSAKALADRFNPARIGEAGREITLSTIEPDQRQKLGSYLAAYSEGARIRLTELKHQLDRIDDSTRHIGNILKDHESLSQWPRHSAPLDCNRLVEETARGVTCPDDVPIDLEVAHLADDLPPVLGHGFIVRQVIGNLLANAVDAIQRAHRKRGRIHVLTRLSDFGGAPMVEIVVGDNGAGFTGLQSEKLFERGYSTRSDRPGGFGLHWCRSALASMNASIVGQSPGPGLGATFRIFLPIAPQVLVSKPDDVDTGDDTALQTVA